MPYSPYASAALPDAEPLPSSAEDVADLISETDDVIRGVHDTLSDLLAALDSKSEAVTDDPTAYTLHHVRSWKAIRSKAADLEMAACELLKLARAA